MSALPEERLGLLRVAKLRALLGEDAGVGDGSPLGTGAGLLLPGGRAAALVERATRRSLGGPLTWAVRRGATELVLVVDADESTAGSLARQAALFDIDVTVQRIVGTSTEPVTPAPYVAGHAGAVDGSAFEPLLRDAGVDVVVEHGVTKGEVLGLEVARVVAIDGEPRLEVGVGRFDREISAMMFANVPTVEALEKAAAMVRRYRAPGADVHPLRDLVPERWLRRLVLDDPSLVGASEVRAADTTVEPESLREVQPTAAVGSLADGGGTVVVIFTAGIDLDVVPLAADTREVIDPDAELVICGPERSLVSATRAVAARLRKPPRFLAIELPY